MKLHEALRCCQSLKSLIYLDSKTHPVGSPDNQTTWVTSHNTTRGRLCRSPPFYVTWCGKRIPLTALMSNTKMWPISALGWLLVQFVMHGHIPDASSVFCAHLLPCLNNVSELSETWGSGFYIKWWVICYYCIKLENVLIKNCQDKKINWTMKKLKQNTVF